MKILALDLGKFNTMCCFFDTKTRKHTFLNAATDRNYLETVFKKHKIDLVAMEACEPSGWINDLAISCGLKTIVCSTNEDAWRWSNVKRKTVAKQSPIGPNTNFQPSSPLAPAPKVPHRQRKTRCNSLKQHECQISVNRSWQNKNSYIAGGSNWQNAVCEIADGSNEQNENGFATQKESEQDLAA